MDTTQGVGFVAFTQDGARHWGDTFAAWQGMPAVGVVLVSVDEPREYAPGKSYRWRMECEWFGCRDCCGGKFLEFARWDAEARPTDTTYTWKRGVLVTDAEMARLRGLMAR